VWRGLAVADLLGVNQQWWLWILEEVAHLANVLIAQERRRDEGDAVDIVDDAVDLDVLHGEAGRLRSACSGPCRHLRQLN
jgi:hypothetical protein